jgi:gluconokinase
MRESKNRANQPQAIVVMGVTGAGKTTIGRDLAAELGWIFVDGDDYHTPDNIGRMATGTPLTDSDREPWLATLNSIMREQLQAETSLVLACSALKHRYRRQLALGVEPITFVYLKLEALILRRRLSERSDHFMDPGLLISQLATLEEPDEAIIVDASSEPSAIVREILTCLKYDKHQE